MVGAKLNSVTENNRLFAWIVLFSCCACAVVTWEMMQLDGVTAAIGVALLLPWCLLLWLFSASHIAIGMEVMNTDSIDVKHAKTEPLPCANFGDVVYEGEGGRVSINTSGSVPGIWITSKNVKQGLPCISIYANDREGLVIGMHRKQEDKGCAFSIGMDPKGEVRLQSIKDGEVVILDFHPLMKALHAIASIGLVSSGS